MTPAPHTDHYETIDIDHANRAEWLEARKTGLGASDMSAVLGINPWKSTLELWLEKTGQMPDGAIEETERMFWGTTLEPSIIRGYELRSGRETQAHGRLLRSKRWPWMLATPDALTRPGASAPWHPLQVKNVGLNQAEKWAEGVPSYYRVQVQQECLVFGAAIGTGAALVGGQQLIWEDVDVDDAARAAIVSAGAHFWELVQARTPPPADGSDSAKRALQILHPREVPGSVVALGDDLLDMHAEREALQREIEERQDRADAISNTLCEAIADGECAVFGDGTGYTYKLQQRAGYTVQPSESRVLRFSKNPLGKKRGK